jgi:hypothetical protein
MNVDNHMDHPPDPKLVNDAEKADRGGYRPFIWAESDIRVVVERTVYLKW